ncbi:amino acid ABC transporter permease [Variovorax rhizosphaerae]|uniref:Amino acid ABC transporter permease n=1 Tax=Variovorax rhizosphaerae TaxID=1836200 RepID=A0ABU8WRW0_9BURK
MELDFSPLWDNWQYLLGGLAITLWLSALTLVASAAAGTGLALLRLYGPRWLSLLLTFYIDSVRAVPVLVVLVWIYFAVPVLSGFNFPPFWAALFALTLHISAYVAEVVRAGIQSIRPGQLRAGRALGMSGAQIVRKVVLPQAFVRMLPSMASLYSVTIKDTAIATVIAVPEFMKRSETIAGQSYHPIEVFSFAMLVYFLILFPGTRLIDNLYKRVAHLGRS